MSVIVTANYEGETLEVEIFQDGSIDFPDRDFQYEKAMAEFAPPGSTTVRFYEKWKEEPIETICGNLNLPENSSPLLAADYAEHILHFFEDKHRDYRRPRDAIEAARDFLAGKTDSQTLVAAEGKAQAAAAAAWTADANAAWEAAWAAAWTANAAWEATGDAAARAAARAADAAAYHFSSDRYSAEWHQARAAEIDWQVRRFVDCMEAISQGFDWPDLGVTK
jgi:hypothetical protein